MLEDIYAFFQWIIDTYSWWVDFVQGGLFRLVEASARLFVMTFMVGAFVFINTIGPMLSDITQTVFIDLNINNSLVNSYNAIPLDIRIMLSYFQIPECISVLVTFGVVRFMMRMVPFI